jgi:hypothetical protein
LGLPVIWSCRDDWFNKTVNKYIEVAIEGKTHKVNLEENRFIYFDVNHYNFIVWKDGEDLYNRLYNRIRATIL